MFKKIVSVSTEMVRVVNSQGKTDAKTREILIPRLLRKKLVEMARQSVESGLAAGTLGELSASLPGGKIASSAAGAAFETLGEADFTVVAQESGKAITDLPAARHVDWHCLVYAHTQAKYALLCQPVYAVVLANRMQPPDPLYLLDAGDAVGGLACVEAEESAIAAALAGSHVLLIRGYGILTWSDDATRILSQAVVTNRWCEITIKGQEERKYG